MDNNKEVSALEKLESYNRTLLESLSRVSAERDFVASELGFWKRLALTGLGVDTEKVRQLVVDRYYGGNVGGGQALSSHRGF